MKKLRNLQQPIVGFGGEPIVDPKGRPVTVRDMILQYMAGHLSNNKEEVFKATAVGIKIYSCKEDVLDLEDAEFMLVEGATSKPQHGDLIMKCIYGAIEQEV